MSISSFDTSPLQQPHTNVSVVDRPRLRQLISTKVECVLTLVTAPAGYGKTMALHQWTSTVGSPVVWVNLKASDTTALDLINRIGVGLRSCADFANLDIAHRIDVSGRS